MKRLTCAILLIVTMLITAYSKQVEDSTVVTLPKTTKIETKQEEARILYEVSFEDTALYLLSGSNLAPAIETYTANIYNICEDPKVFWYGDVEIFITTNIQETDVNTYTNKGIILATEDTDFDLSSISEFIVDKLPNDIIIPVEQCKLNAIADDPEWAAMFPGYNSSDVYSYSKAEKSDGTSICVLQRVTDSGITYECIGIGDKSYYITPYFQLVIGDNEEVIELEFCTNPNYVPN